MNLFCLEGYIRSLHGWNFLFSFFPMGFLATYFDTMVGCSTDNNTLSVFLRYCIYISRNNILAIAFPNYLYLSVCIYAYLCYLLKIASYMHIVQYLNLLSLWFPKLPMEITYLFLISGKSYPSVYASFFGKRAILCSNCGSCRC